MKMLEHGDIEVAKWLILITAEGQVLTMPKATTSQQNGQVCVVVGVGVSHVTAEQDHGAVQETIFVFTSLGKL